MIRKLAVTLLLMLAAAPSPAAAGYDEAILAYTQGDFATALGEFKPLARTRDSRAEFMLGVIYFNGTGVPQDYAVAAILFRLAAEQGEAAAQLALGSVYIRGIGVRQNLAHAHYWLTVAAGTASPALVEQAEMLRRATSTLMTAEEMQQAEGLVASWQQPGLVGLVMGR